MQAQTKALIANLTKTFSASNINKISQAVIGKYSDRATVESLINVGKNDVGLFANSDVVKLSDNKSVLEDDLGAIADEISLGIVESFNNG